jgi:hypothetical protein
VTELVDTVISKAFDEVSTEQKDLQDIADALVVTSIVKASSGLASESALKSHLASIFQDIPTV